MLTTPSAGEDMEQQELPLIAGGNAEWYSYFGIQFGVFLQSQIYPYLMIQQSYSLIFTQVN